MADDRTDPTDEIPEADRLEQDAAAAPSDAEGVDALAGALPDDVDPADRQEQLTVVDEDDEDYPRA